jgi:hypothetical protein
VRETKIVLQEKKYSESETSSKESDNISNAVATTWVKEDKMTNLGPFTVNLWMKQILTQQKYDK